MTGVCLFFLVVGGFGFVPLLPPTFIMQLKLVFSEITFKKNLHTPTFLEVAMKFISMRPVLFS